MILKPQRKAIEEDAFHLDNGYICHSLEQAGPRGIFYGIDPLNFTTPALLLQLSLISLFTWVTHFLLKPFGQPSIVSQILGGVVLGPSVLGHNREFLAELFPAKSRILLDNLSVFSLMLFIFLLGVKMDITLALRSGKKPIAIGILGFIIPYGFASLAAFLLKKYVTLEQDISKILPFVVEIQSMSAFPVIACFLADLKILNSEIGRLASSSSIVSDVFQWSLITIKFGIKIGQSKSFSASIGSFLSVALFIMLALYGIRPVVLWAIRKTPEGQPVKERYIVGIFVALLGCGFIGEVIGISAVAASFIVGLVIPDGPPIGAALSEKLDSFVSVLMMPIFFAICGLQMDVFAIQKLKNVGIVQVVVFVAFIGKIVGTIAPPLFFRMPFRDALSLSLIMNAKGIIELAIIKNSGLTDECFAIMIISVVFITGVLSPIVKSLYDPSRRYLAFKRRTIRHHKRNEELCILACVHNPDNVRSIMDVLQISTPTKLSPINLTVMHLTKLIGRSSSVLVAHQPRETSSAYPSQSERIFNAFNKLEQQNEGLFKVQCYKGVSPFASMHDDVCFIALEKRTSFVLIPFQRQSSVKEMLGPSFAYRNLNKNVLDKAPCSVGILVDHGGSQKKNKVISLSSDLVTTYHVAVLFFGGPDDREALAYGMRMSDSSQVKLTLIRIFSASEDIDGSEQSILLDGDILSEFRLGTLHKEDRVFSEEMILTNAMNLITLIRSLESSNYDFILVGRYHRDYPFMKELIELGDYNGELGPIGEMLAWNHKIRASILVIQQQTRLWGLQHPE